MKKEKTQKTKKQKIQNKKTNKKSSNIIKLIIIIGLSLIIIGIFCINVYVTKIFTNPIGIEEHECTKKGNICTDEDIYNGLEVAVEVKENVTYRFYMISNTEDNMTLIMANNVNNQEDWHNELINMKGPTKALGTLIERTKAWDNVDDITNFTYEDYGLKSFIENCQNNTTEPDYDCNNGQSEGRAYKSVNITKNKVEYIYNMETIDGMEPAESFSYAAKAKARLITLEEVFDIAKDKKIPRWLSVGLKDQQGYWTMSSSTAMNTQYSAGAFAITNTNEETTIESLYVNNSLNSGYLIGLRPVITITKK